MNLSPDDIDVLLDALAMAASRREAMANAVKSGRHHDEAARQMRELRFRLMKIKQENRNAISSRLR